MPKILIGNIKGPQGAQGIQGPQGPVGATGPQGPMPDLINNALATEAGVAALDAAMGKTLQDQLTELNSNLQTTNFKAEKAQFLDLQFGMDANVLIVGAIVDGCTLQLVADPVQILFQKRSTPDGEWEAIWSK